MKHFFATILFSLSLVSSVVQAQDVYMPYNQDTYHLIDRYQIKYGNQVPQLHTNVKPFGRRDVAALAETVAPHAQHAVDQFNTQYLLNDNWNYTALDSNESKKPILNYFYRNKTDLYHYENKDFSVRVNPVFHGELGLDNQIPDYFQFTNTRGIQLEGSLDGRFGFYTFIGENQVRYPAYVVDRINRDGVVPHEGYWKYFKGDQGYDFITARAYLNYSLSKHVEIQLGHDRHFIGDGYRSLVYSDYAPPAFFLKLNTRVWKLHYMNLFQELTADYERGGDDLLLPKKYMAFHRLGINITNNFNLGLFESIILSREKGRFELQYLNPIIFYRSIEQMLGSQDNAMLGADFRWNIRNRVQVYGQLMLDEFLLREIKAMNGWWANKQAGQVGVKYIDALGIPNLDLQGEVNIIRPYTYQHIDQYTNYQHYRQSLAHPNGANLYEFIGIVRYQPMPRLSLVGKAIATQFGQDLVTATDTINWGNNVNLSYGLRPSTYGHSIAQGISTSQLHLDVTATYQFRHNVFMDLKGIIRNTNATESSLSRNSNIVSLAFRWNIPQRLNEF
ncbi:hypothetical protein [Pontibacter sp. SGAir0037]|uniref:hypothetical protein n=1 Tax=Pontibacter sp. SGAir0037 TaxID=2571030 RepID=UPI0010CD123B|nr:hypothetical protein [Pontibacter sp. SGAir0037]QCR24380.1 hypothetical protein C1N53_19795 [Pontibacter sp. SGAir0037]